MFLIDNRTYDKFVVMYIVVMFTIFVILTNTTIAQENETNSVTVLQEQQIQSFSDVNSIYIKIVGNVHNIQDRPWCEQTITMDLGVGTATCTYNPVFKDCLCDNMRLPAYTKPKDLFMLDMVSDNIRQQVENEYKQRLNESNVTITELQQTVRSRTFMLAFFGLVAVFLFGIMLFLIFYVTKVYPNFRWRLGE